MNYMEQRERSANAVLREWNLFLLLFHEAVANNTGDAVNVEWNKAPELHRIPSGSQSWNINQALQIWVVISSYETRHMAPLCPFLPKVPALKYLLAVINKGTWLSPWWQEESLSILDQV